MPSTITATSAIDRADDGHHDDVEIALAVRQAAERARASAKITSGRKLQWGGAGSEGRVLINRPAVSAFGQTGHWAGMAE